MGPLFHPRSNPITVNGKRKYTIIMNERQERTEWKFFVPLGISESPSVRRRNLRAFNTVEISELSKLRMLQNRRRRLDNEDKNSTVSKALSFRTLGAFKISSARRFQRFRKQSLSKVRTLSFQKAFDSLTNR